MSLLLDANFDANIYSALLVVLTAIVLFSIAAWLKKRTASTPTALGKIARNAAYLEEAGPYHDRKEILWHVRCALCHWVIAADMPVNTFAHASAAVIKHWDTHHPVEVTVSAPPQQTFSQP